jgi:molybdenum cofactor guanylyltransferase
MPCLYNHSHMHFTTIILAGGLSTRMGSNKALISYQGKPLIRYPLDLVSSFPGNILISANNNDLGFLGLQIVNDRINVKAPLAGIHAGLKASRTAWNLVLTCDMPHVTRELINKMSLALDADLKLVLPQHNGFIEPLCGFYHRDLIPLIENNFAAGRLSLLDLPGVVPHKFFAMDGLPPAEITLLFKNVNEKRDLIN